MDENPYQSPQFCECEESEEWSPLHFLKLFAWSHLGLGWLFLMVGFSVWGRSGADLFIGCALSFFILAGLTFLAILIGSKNER
jgi:hypothetical protein